MFYMVDSLLCKILALYCILGFFFPLGQMNMILTGVGLIFVIFLLLVKSIRNRNFAFFIISLFAITYCVVPLGYLFGSKEHIVENITMSETPSTVFLASHCLLTFLSFFLIYVKFDIPIERRVRKTYISMPDIKGYYICLLISILCVTFGISGDNIFQTGGYGVGDAERYSLYEYGIIPTLLMLVYSQKRSQRKFVYALCLVYILIDLFYGGRIFSIQLILAVFIMQFLNSFNFRQLGIMLVCGYVFFQFWGYFRQHIDNTGFDIMEGDANSQYVVYASMRIHYMIDCGILNWTNRLVSFVSFILSFFVPSIYLPDLANLASYKQSEYYTGGGGLISTFFYCWAWMPGVVIMGILIGKIMNHVFHSKSIYWNFYALLVIITIPRWFAYYPIHLFKFAGGGVVLFFILNKILSIKIFKKKVEV